MDLQNNTEDFYNNQTVTKCKKYLNDMFIVFHLILLSTESIFINLEWDLQCDVKYIEMKFMHWCFDATAEFFHSIPSLPVSTTPTVFEVLQFQIFSKALRS